MGCKAAELGPYLYFRNGAGKAEIGCVVDACQVNMPLNYSWRTFSAFGI